MSELGTKLAKVHVKSHYTLQHYNQTLPFRLLSDRVQMC